MVDVSESDMEAFTQMRDKIATEATLITEESLPFRVKTLGEIYETCKAELERDPAPLELVRDKPIAMNPNVRRAVVILKSEIRVMLNDLSTLRVWIRLHMPRMEDGNNFGVEVQEEILSMVNGLYASGLAFLKNISNYYFKRGKLVSDYLKYPNIEDFKSGIEDLDHKQHCNLVQSCCDLRNSYAFLYDKIAKNKQKLIKPKGNTDTRGVMY